MLTTEYLKSAIELAEKNCSGKSIEYTIDEVKELSEEGAYLVIAHSEDCETSFVAYEDGTCYFLSDWQGAYPKTEDEIKDFDNWVTINWESLPIIFNGLPRRLL